MGFEVVPESSNITQLERPSVGEYGQHYGKGYGYSARLLSMLLEYFTL